MRYVYIIMFVFTFLSCQDKNKEAMLRLVKEWDGKEIKFPARSVFTIQGKDTVNFDFKDADYKVVSEQIDGDVAYVELSGYTVLKQMTRFNVRLVKVDGAWKVDGDQSVIHGTKPMAQ